jgi:sulfate adenylyltransferase subunit 1
MESILTKKYGMELLRFSTAGSVDDGKSTLIGRLLFDTKSVFEDQLEALQRSTDITGEGSINLANLTDGLRAEREQGITIDVAYRYFATPRRKFIVADTPGHLQYTRNMVTGASTADLAIVLIDARQGVIQQTKRHAYISSLLRIPNLVVCVNKMDLVDFAEGTFNKIREQFLSFSNSLSFKKIEFIPVCALHGDNIVDGSNRMPWYSGPALLRYLEEVDCGSDLSHGEARFPVQYVIRPRSDEFHDFRGIAGQIASGTFRKGDAVKVLPSGKLSLIAKIHTYDGELEIAKMPMSVSFLLEDDIDIGRGDLLVHPDHSPALSREFDATICWMSEQPLLPGHKYAIKHLSRNARCIVKSIYHRVDMEAFEQIESVESLGLNDIARVRIQTAVPLPIEPYEENRGTGGFIIVDEATNATLAAGMICRN